MAKFKITGLPKAQIGGKTATSLLFSPYEQGMFSNSLHSIGGADPSFILGAERSNLFPIWGHNNGVRSSLSGQVQIPYAMNQIPGVKGRWTSEYSPNAGKSPVQFTTTGQLEGGYNPDQGFNASIMGWPHVWGSTVDVSRWRNPEKYYAGAVRAGIGPQLGGSYMSGMMNSSGPNYISGTDQMNTNKGSVHIGGRGYVEYTPTDWLKLRLDAQGMFDPLTKKVAEGTDAGNAAETENVNLKFSPGVQLTATVPIKALASNKKKASEEKVKMDAVKADDKNIMVEAPVMTGPGIDWEYRQKQQSTGVPVGHLPGYEPETGRQLTEAELMQRYGQGPRLTKGGTANDIYLDLDDDEIEQYRNAGYIVEDLPEAQKGGEQTYTYADRPEATYKKDAKGNWLISLPSTDGKYVPIKDPSGKRAGELNEKAKPVEKPTLMTKAYSSVKDFNRLPEADKKARASMYAFNEKMRNSGMYYGANGWQRPMASGAAQSADWFWTLPIALPAITQTLGGIGAMSLPGMASIPGATVGNLVNSGFIASSLMGAPGNVMDWYNVIQGKKDWKDAAMDSADIALGFIGSGSGWKSLIQDAKTLKAPSKIVSKTRSTVGNVIKPGVLSAKPNQYSIAGQRGAAGKTGLDASHVEDVRKKAIARLQSDDYLKKRMANTGETEEQVRADVKKIISEAEDAKYNLNAYISTEGVQTPKGLQNLWRYPTVDISKNAENPITTLIHENNHLYSPAGYSQHLGRMVQGRGNPNIASIPFGKKRGVYANYPQLGVTDDIGEYEAREWEQQVRHLNARDQIISANNLAEDAKVTPEMVEKFAGDWFKRMKTEGAVGEDYDLIWNSELRNVRETLAKEKGYANTAELEKNLTEADKAAFLAEVRKRFSEKVAGVLNNAWMGVPAVIGAGALGAGATDGEFKKGGFPKNIGKLKKFIR